MTEASAGADQTAAPVGEYISLVRIKSSDDGLRVLFLPAKLSATRFQCCFMFVTKSFQNADRCDVLLILNERE